MWKGTFRDWCPGEESFTLPWKETAPGSEEAGGRLGLVEDEDDRPVAEQEPSGLGFWKGWSG